MCICFACIMFVLCMWFSCIVRLWFGLFWCDTWYYALITIIVIGEKYVGSVDVEQPISDRLGSDRGFFITPNSRLPSAVTIGCPYWPQRRTTTNSWRVDKQRQSRSITSWKLSYKLPKTNLALCYSPFKDSYLLRFWDSVHLFLWQEEEAVFFSLHWVM